MKQQLENQKEVLFKEAMPSAPGQVFLWENNTALQGLDACLSLLFSSHVQLPADRIPPKSTYLWLAHLVSCSG